jgi:hypothetical protein
LVKVASKQKRINEIVSMLEKGMERKAILQKLTKTYKVSNGTIDKEIKEAKSILFERNEHKENIRVATTTNTLKEAINEAILSDLEIEAILSKIVSGNMQVEQIIDGTPILRDITPNEVINAAKVIYTKRGSNAPTKVAQTDTKGNDKESTITLIMPEGLNIDFPSNLTEDAST